MFIPSSEVDVPINTPPTPLTDIGPLIKVSNSQVEIKEETRFVNGEILSMVHVVKLLVKLLL